MLKLMKKGAEAIIPYTAEEALGYKLDSDMSRDVYNQTRLGAKKGTRIYTQHMEKYRPKENYAIQVVK